MARRRPCASAAEPPQHLVERARAALAWRMRLLERDALLTRLRRSGIPVVAWRGPGTLDEVLRRLGRRGARTTAGHR